MVRPHCALLQAAVAGTDFYEDYTGIRLPLPKLDMVAIPGKRGAVEHWGLLQFDEERMLVNKVGVHCFLFTTPSQGVGVSHSMEKNTAEDGLQLRNMPSAWFRLRLEALVSTAVLLSCVERDGEVPGRCSLRGRGTTWCKLQLDEDRS